MSLRSTPSSVEGQDFIALFRGNGTAAERSAARLDDGPAHGGFSSLPLPSEEALIGGYFDSDRGRTEIRADIRHFTRGIPPRMFATLHRYERI